MTVEQDSLLRELAGKYVWWKTPGQSMVQPQLIAAQVMNIGDYDDGERLADALGDDFLRSVLRTAEIGQFDDRSWHYWHYRLGMAVLGSVPAQPIRKLA